MRRLVLEWRPTRRSRHRPGHAIMPGLVVAVALRGIAIDQGPAVERMSLAAHLVLDGKEHLARVEVDHVLEAIFVVVDLHRDQPELLELAIGAGKIREIDLRVMAVIGLLRLVRLAEIPVLLLPDLNAGFAAAAVLQYGNKGPHDFAIKARDTLGR